MKLRLHLFGLVTLAAFLLAGCNYEVPLTARATRNVDARLLGVWLGGDDGKDNMVVRSFDEGTYVVAMDHDLYRAYHSDFAGTAFVSVQDLNADNRKYVYFTWKLSPDNTQLTLVGVSNKVVPETVKDRGAIQKLIKANLANPALYGDPLTFTRKKPR